MENLDFLTKEENEARKKFLGKFNIKKLNEIEDIELPYKIYGNIEHDSMAYNIEFALNKDFGNMSGTAKNITYPIYLKKEDNTWKKHNDVIQFEEATRISIETKDCINSIDKLIKINKMDDLFKFLNNKRYIFEFRLMHKYLCVVYPTLFLHWHIKEKFKEYMKILNLNYDNNSIFVVEKYFWDKYKGKIESLNMKEETEKLEQQIKEQKNNNKKSTKIKEIKQPLNQILYGPPGTGKTYNAIIKAMEIIDKNKIKYDENNNISNYKELEKEFNELKQIGQIKFVTFHQSYSYEEFIEGIKPDVNNPEKIVYKIEEGIFKKIVDDALFNALNITEKQEQKEKEFYDVLNIFKINHQEGTELSTVSSKSKFTIVEYSKDSIRIKPKDGNNIYSVSYGPLQEIYEKDKKNNISTANELVERMNGSFAGLSSYYFAVLDSLKKYVEQINTTNKKTIDFNKSKFLEQYYNGNMQLKEKSNRYILIIDEINRGNISKIFGEMITLIEEDKRIGNEHELKLTLPYSKEPFGIPNNLYVIGTMNTSDRSIASIDIALRRRFKFIEMMPQNNLVADFRIEFNKIFEALNNKIKILLDRDHQIGHSYFISTKYNDNNKNNDIKTLKNIWFDEILPLLNEYFYNDWEKLNLIIPGFIKKVNIPTSLENEYENAYEFKTLKDFENDTDDVNFKDAIEKILG